MKRLLAFLVLSSLFVSFSVAPAGAVVAPGTIDTVAGGGDGDGALALDARMASGDVDVDAAGNLYVVDWARIRRVDAATGIVTTVAGTGVPGFSGDGGLATAAQIEGSTHIALHTNGDLYISQSGSGTSVVRKVDAITGIIDTVAGSGASGFSGDGGPATAAQLSGPQDVDLDAAGSLYIADRINKRIRKVDAGTGIITTVAGNGGTGQTGDGAAATAAQIGEAWGVGVNSSGDVYIGTVYGGRVRRVDSVTQIITTVLTTTGRPEGVDFDSADNAYVSDFIDDKIFKITPAGTVTTFAGGNGDGFSGDGGLATAAQLGNPRDVAVDASDNVYSAENGSNRVRQIDAITGIIDTVAGGGADDGIPATDSSFYPEDVASDSLGNLYITDPDDDRIRRVDVTTGIISTVAGNGQNGFSGDGGPATDAKLNEPNAVAVAPGGDIIIVDSGQTRLRRVDGTTAVITTIAGTGVSGFGGDGGPATAAQFDAISDVVVDGAGNIYVADKDNNRIRMIDTGGTVTTFAGTGTEAFSGDGGLATAAELDDPTLLALDPITGDLAIWDRDNLRVRVVDGSGIISTVAGDGTGPTGGDGGPATSAQVASVGGLAYELGGNLLISDRNSLTVRRVAGCGGVIDSIVGSGASPSSGDGGPPLAAGFDDMGAIDVGPFGDLSILDERLLRQVAPGAPGSVSGRVFMDEAGTPGIEGVRVALRHPGPNGCFEPSGDDIFTPTLTAADGSYEFLGLEESPYRVAVIDSTLPPDLALTVGADPTNLTLTSGEGATVDFGYVDLFGSVSGRVFMDEAGTPGIEGIRVTLRDPGPNGAFEPGGDDIFTPTLTAADGSYEFLGLEEGLYRVAVIDSTLPGGLTLTVGADPTNLTLTSGEDATVDFGYTDLFGSVSGRVFMDEAGTPGIEGVRVALRDPGPNGVFEPGGDDIFTPTLTAADGSYEFLGLEEGPYRVAVIDSTLPGGLTLTVGADPTNLTLTSGEDATVDFGYQPV